MDFLNILTTRLNDLLVAIIEHLPAMGMAALIVLLTFVFARVTDRILMRLLDRTDPRRSLRVFFRKLAGISTWTIGLLVAAVVAFPSVTPGKLLSALGLGSIAIGFAFKDIFENFIAGMLILLREPFRLGDHVICEGVAGTVQEITVRDTRIRRVNGEDVTLPNAMLFKHPVKVQTAQDLRRIDIVCGVAYHEDVDHCREVIEQAVKACDTVEEEKPVQVFALEFGASSIDFQIAWWTGSDPLSERRSRDQVIAAVKAALDEAGIEIPFPYRTLTFHEPLPMRTETDTRAHAEESG